jgi:outer membrane protein assembly factor BamD
MIGTTLKRMSFTLSTMHLLGKRAQRFTSVLVFGALVAVGALGSSGCSSTSPAIKAAEGTPDRMLAEAKEEMDGGRWGEAVKKFEALEAKFPFGSFAQQAQLDIAYSHYKNNEPAQALAAVERFARQFPNSKSLDYALYLKGLVSFNEESGFLARFGGQDLAERDSRAARESFEAFRDLIARFPESKYVGDATARMRYLVNSLAMSEVHIARHYVRRGAYVAAANRAQMVVKNFQETPAIEEALGILVTSYAALHLDTQRQDAERVLRQNFPKSGYLPKTATPR